MANSAATILRRMRNSNFDGMWVSQTSYTVRRYVTPIPNEPGKMHSQRSKCSRSVFVGQLEAAKRPEPVEKENQAGIQCSMMSRCSNFCN